MKGTNIECVTIEPLLIPLEESLPSQSVQNTASKMHL